MAGLEDFSHAKGLFSVKYPKGWVIEENQFVASFSCPTSAGPMPLNFNVAVLPLEQNMPLEEVTRGILSKSQMMPNFTLISTEDLPISGYPGKLLQFALREMPPFQPFGIAFVQAITITPKGNLCTASFSGLTDDLSQYSKHFKAIFQSLTLHDKEVLIPIDSLYLRRYANEKSGFDVLYPITWAVAELTNETKNDPRIVSATQMTYTWKQSNADVELEALFVVEKQSEKVKTLDDYLLYHDVERTKELSIPGVKTRAHSTNKRVVLGGKEGHFLAYVDPITKRKTWRAFTLHNSKVYVVSFFSTGALDDNREAPMISRMFESFRFNAKPSTEDLCRYDNLLLNFGFTFDAQQSPPAENPSSVTCLRYLPSNRDPESMVIFNVFAKEEEHSPLSEFAQRSLDTLKEELSAEATSFSASSPKDATLGGEKAVENTVETTLGGTQVNLRRWVAIRSGTAFTVTVEGRASDIDSKVTNYFQRVLESFEFFSPDSPFTPTF